jgi:polysaccharide biosynthesis protein PslF
VLFIGSFPPRQCGIATFTSDLVENYDRSAGERSEVVAIDDRSANYLYGPRVITRLREDDLRSYYAAASRINAHPSRVVNIQHEYGLFGGEGGAWAAELIAAIEKPVVLTLHTVLPNPDEHHAKLARRLVERAAHVVVLSLTARRFLIERYGIERTKVSVIHHGAPDVSLADTGPAKAAIGVGDRPVVSTFGLLSRDKGLEYAVAAIHEIARVHPNVLYLIIGATHPNVVRAEGEGYRASLHERIGALGLGGNVTTIHRYLSLPELLAYLQATDVYVTPYVNADQIVSGTLAYALAAGKPIVSTPYAYARELLADGRGLLARFRDSHSLAEGVNRLLDDPELRKAVSASAYAFGRRMTWRTVAMEYARVFATTAVRPAEVRRLAAAETPLRVPAIANSI